MSTIDSQLAGLRRLADAGAQFVPIPPRSKNPGRKGWKTERHTLSDIEAYLRRGGNAGMLLIDGRTDLDLDCSEAIALADDFLPQTDCTFGRPSSRRAHRLYRSEPGATYQKYVDPLTADKKNATILEVRAAAPGKGLQTVIPGSTHPSGEPITFDEDGEPAHVNGPALMVCAADLAAACLLGRYWPAKGSRHDVALAIAGFLLRGGLDVARVERIVCQAARMAGDEEWQERRKDVESTDAALRAGKPVTGGPTLADLVGDKIVTAIGKWLMGVQLKSTANAEGDGDGNTEGNTTTDVDGLVNIQVNDRQLRDISHDAAKALEAANTPPQLFVQANRLVRAGRDELGAPYIEGMTKDSLRGNLTRCANFYETKKMVFHAVAPPIEVVCDLLASQAHPFPTLAGIVESPVLQPDGTVLNADGYDPITCLLYYPAKGLVVPSISDHPSRAQVADAVAEIDAIFCDFPFVDKASKANFYGLLITLIVRPAFPGLAPLALIDKPSPGTGAGLLTKVLGLVTTGRPPSVTTMTGNEEELRKRITSQLLSGTPLVLIDNVTERLESTVLSAVLTADVWEDRLLGGNEMARAQHHVTWLVTGNNLTLGGDIPRRSYWIRLDSNSARPWERKEFRIPELEEYVRARRGTILAALLTLCRAWFAAGKPAATVPVIGSFEAWCRMVGGILAFAGIEGFLGNLAGLYEQVDEETTEWCAFITAWHEKWGAEEVTTAQLVDGIKAGSAVCADSYSAALKASLPSDLADASEGKGAFSKQLGIALAARKDRIYGELRLGRVPGKNRHGVARWQVQSPAEAKDGTVRRSMALSGDTVDV